MPKPSSRRIPVRYLPGEKPSNAGRLAEDLTETASADAYDKYTTNETPQANEHPHSLCHRKPHGPDHITWRYAGDWSHVSPAIVSTTSFTTYSTAQSDVDDTSSFFSAFDALAAGESPYRQLPSWMTADCLPSTTHIRSKPVMQAKASPSPALNAFRRVVYQVIPQYFKRRNV